MTHGERLKELVQKELALRHKYANGQISFSDWMKHIRGSHDELLRMLSGESIDGCIEIEVVEGSNPRVLAVYELPACCRRIAVGVSSEANIIGYSSILDGPIEQHSAKLLSKSPFGPTAKTAAVPSECS